MAVLIERLVQDRACARSNPQDHSLASAPEGSGPEPSLPLRPSASENLRCPALSLLGGIVSAATTCATLNSIHARLQHPRTERLQLSRFFDTLRLHDVYGPRATL